MVILKHLDHRKLLISKSQSLVVYDAVSDTISDVGLPVSTDGETVTAIATSKCGGYFAVLRGKRVTVYDSGATVVKELVLKRAAHSITLFDGHNMLVADKTGDVYLYKADSNECVLLLGHLSMLLDVVLSDDGKFLITCDRDEKIRVSRYPNTYDIERFCLGHGEFVTKMALLEGGPYLASASGDGKVIVWNYLKGDVLHSVDTAAHVDDRTAINDFVESMEQDKCEVTSLPIVDMQIRKWDAFYCVVVQIYRLKHLQVYSLNVADNTFDSKLLQNIRFATEIETFSLNRELFVSTEESVSMFIVSENIFVEKQNDTLEKLKLSGARDKCCDISTLYKRRFDNVQEYLERKRQRMEGK